MLVLSRKVGEQVLVGDQVVLTVVRIGQNAVRIGIEAPKDMNIVRSEIGQPSPIYSTAPESRPHIPSIAEHAGAGMWDGEPV